MASAIETNFSKSEKLSHIARHGPKTVPGT